MSQTESNDEASQLKQAQEEIRRLRELSGRCSELLQVGMWVIEEGRVVEANERAAKMLGLELEELLALENVALLVGEEERPEVEQHLKERLAGRLEEQRWDLKLKRPNGETVVFEVLETVIDREGRPAIYGNLIDVTDKRRIEERLRKSEERFRYASRATQEVLWERDLVADTMWCSEGIRIILKVSNEQLPRTFDEWVGRVHPEDRDNVVSAVEEVIKSRHHLWLNEYRFQRGDGEYAHILDRAFVLYQSDGEPLRMIGSMLDITEKKELEVQLNQAQRLGNIGSVARGVAHDLNNVLTPILTAIQALKEDLFLEDGTKKIVDSIEENSRRGAKVVSQILQYTEPRSAEHVNAQLQHQLADIVSIIRETFPRSINIEMAIDQDLFEVRADPAEMDQLFFNLCVNARDAMPDGGTLTIRIENVQLDKQYTLMQSQLKAGTYVKVSVADDGKGIPPDQIRKIFLPFQKGDADSKGQGLGLTTVMRVVKTHHGTIDVDSEPGKGSRFDVYLPAVIPEGGEEEEDSEEDDGKPPKGSGETILVVDDEDTICEMSRMTLERHGYRVLTASNGAAAISVFCQSQDRIALVVMDVVMPTMDGIAAVEVLHRIDPKTRILISSGSLRSRSEIEAKKVKVEAFLRKPYTAPRLLNAIHNVLHGKPED